MSNINCVTSIVELRHDIMYLIDFTIDNFNNVKSVLRGMGYSVVGKNDNPFLVDVKGLMVEHEDVPNMSICLHTDSIVIVYKDKKIDYITNSQFNKVFELPYAKRINTKEL